MTNEEIRQIGQQIYDETEVAANTSERVGGVIRGIAQNLVNKDAAAAAQAARNGYYECNVNNTTLAVTAAGYTLPASGGKIRIKMSAPATGACTLNINSTGAKPLLYNGGEVSSANTWEQNEIISVFYDPSENGRYMASNSQGGGGKAEKISYDNSQSGLAAQNVQEAVDELAKEVDISVSGVSLFEQGQIDDSGKDSTASASASYYIRTPASSPITILNGQTMNLKFNYKNSIGTVINPDNTRIYKYLDGVYVGRVQTTAKTAVVECDGTFNQIRIRAYRNGIGSLYSYCSVEYNVPKSIKGMAEQVDTNTANIDSITSNLQGISETVVNMQGQTINKRVYTSADLGSSYYDLENPYQTTSSYSIYGGIKVPVKRGDHITLYTIEQKLNRKDL